jgi:hypothetical protein
MRIRISVGITIRIIIGGRITTGITCTRKMGITVSITTGFTITINITVRITDESGLSRNCAEAAGLPPATLKALKRFT